MGWRKNGRVCRRGRHSLASALLRATANAQANASDALSVARREKRYGFIRRKLRRLARSLGCRKAVRKLARPTGGGAPAEEQKEP